MSQILAALQLELIPPAVLSRYLHPTPLDSVDPRGKCLLRGTVLEEHWTVGFLWSTSFVWRPETVQSFVLRLFPFYLLLLKSFGVWLFILKANRFSMPVRLLCIPLQSQPPSPNHSTNATSTCVLLGLGGISLLILSPEPNNEGGCFSLHSYYCIT